MSFLLFFISFVFSFIFYIFYCISEKKDIFLNEKMNSFSIISLSWDLLIESFLFFLIWLILLYSFSSFKEKTETHITNHKIGFFYFLYYLVLIFFVIIFFKDLHFHIILMIVLFIISDVTFWLISNFSFLSKYKITLKYFSLILNYIVSIIWIIYIFQNWLFLWVSLIVLIILIHNIFFNFFIHKNYTNYISLFFWIIISFSLIYQIYLIWYNIFNEINIYYEKFKIFFNK